MTDDSDELVVPAVAASGLTTSAEEQVRMKVVRRRRVLALVSISGP
ncbi:hypothetical protein GCM10011509_29970 [Ornithinimicrobium pekingense]|uniref:Uncharacterized protein n=1 Tax=Ornithinimicrobium pekingense TaxID=384677 RepID=A0ABQ2FDS3_9MICO|nr:hypothetical protein GCM10011509_29970 [Ornithinimicrobium pekingense]